MVMNNPVFILVCIVFSIVIVALIFRFALKNAKKFYGKGVKGKDYYTGALVKKDSLGDNLRKLFTGKNLDDNDLLKLEEVLLSSDIGPQISSTLITKLRLKGLNTIESAIEFLKKELHDIICNKEYILKDGVLNIVLVLGVNGVGKTTSIGKLANFHLKKGKTVLLAAADTFRAAATEQLTRWAKVMDIPIVKQGEGADPASVVYDAVDSAKSKGVDLLIIDTAGRLQNKKHLMDELKKMYKIIESKGGCDTHNLLVIDATTGQNAFHQAQVFNEVVGVNMIMMTKYDALSKGGIVFNISKKLNIPFTFIGKGEKIEDIEVFNREKFIERIFN